MSAKLGALASAYVGRRVELAPHLDAWMAGNRFGTIVRVSSRGFRVRLDAPIARTGDRADCAKCGARITYARASLHAGPGWEAVRRLHGRLCDQGGLHTPKPVDAREITLTNDQIGRYVS